MKFRHELKHEINLSDMLTLRTRLSSIMKPDPHATAGRYKIRSLYFDDISDSALMEKINGTNAREKFRIRFYNEDDSYIVLEKKTKINNLCSKESCRLSKEEAQMILDEDVEWMKDADRPLCAELYSKMAWKGLKPKTIVDYTREPFVFSAGNVRVTIDYDIRTGAFRTDFLNPETLTLPAGASPIILEVKWDEFLPEIIKEAVHINGRHSFSFSKYEQCRIYG
ncbi:MAG: polyphosphate polymerase domain-containing protein [Lachnospiraceae bacterium]|nr:polyphosphate polymerase domain-containing protein [Lachnospiraceae bacterium]